MNGFDPEGMRDTFPWRCVVARRANGFREGDEFPLARLLSGAKVVEVIDSSGCGHRFYRHQVMLLEPESREPVGSWGGRLPSHEQSVETVPKIPKRKKEVEGPPRPKGRPRTKTTHEPAYRRPRLVGLSVEEKYTRRKVMTEKARMRRQEERDRESLGIAIRQIVAQFDEVVARWLAAEAERDRKSEDKDCRWTRWSKWSALSGRGRSYDGGSHPGLGGNPSVENAVRAYEGD